MAYIDGAMALQFGMIYLYHNDLVRNVAFGDRESCHRTKLFSAVSQEILFTCQSPDVVIKVLSTEGSSR